MRQPERVCEILRSAGMTLLDEQAVEIEGVGFGKPYVVTEI
jgi:hypothetical protein